MKFFAFVVLCVAVGIASAEPPRFISGRFQSRFLSRQEAEPTTPADETEAEAPPPSPPAGGPYPPSGWRPTGKAFELPSEKTEETTPEGEYGAPTYGPPVETYGAPTTLPSETESTTEAEEGTTVEPLSESIDDNLTIKIGRLRKSQRIQVQNTQAEEGALYILLADSTLQKIYSPRAARINSKFSGRLIQQAQPLSAPVVFFAPQSARF